MCGGGGGGGSDAVKYQREQEAERQRNIENGKMQLERIFAGLEGDEYRIVNPAATYSQDEYMDAVAEALRGNVVAGQAGGGSTRLESGGVGGYDSGSNPAGGRGGYQRPGRLHSGYVGGYDSGYHQLQQRREREQQQGGASTGPALSSAGAHRLRQLGLSDEQIGSTNVDDYAQHYRALVNRPGSYQRIEGAGTPIWEQQQQAYMDYAQPQLEDQYGDAREKLTYALANQGQLAGSLSGERYADLNQDYDLRRQEVADQARGYANQARSDIASQKQSLLQMLSATADPGATATAARSAVGSLQQTPSFSALGPLFQNATAGLAAGLQGRQAGQMEQQQQGIIYGRDPDKGSGRVLNR